MNFVDTHSHLYSSKFTQDMEAVIARCQQENVTKVYLPNIDNESVEPMLELRARDPERFRVMFGLHPCYVKKGFERELYRLEEWMKAEDFVAVGEIGLDLYWDKSLFEYQKEAFRIQIQWAKERRLPIVIHSREANREAMDLVREEKDDQLRGIFHCFSGSLSQAQEMIEMDFLLGIGGVVTFKNGGLDKVLPDVSLDHLVLETDSPYLAPVPYRGKRNESSYTPLIAKRLAEIKNCTLEEVATRTTSNAQRLFHPNQD